MRAGGFMERDGCLPPRRMRAGACGRAFTGRPAAVQRRRGRLLPRSKNAPRRPGTAADARPPPGPPAVAGRAAELRIRRRPARATSTVSWWLSACAELRIRRRPARATLKAQ